MYDSLASTASMAAVIKVGATVRVSARYPKARSTPATMSKQRSTLLPKNGNNVERNFVLVINTLWLRTQYSIRTSRSLCRSSLLSAEVYAGSVAWCGRGLRQVVHTDVPTYRPQWSSGSVCLSRQPLWYTALDTGCTPLLQCPGRLSLPFFAGR